jgi:BirA family biotin operon repressor/biotin-[acetyl-CoA-carboxylase] ligase
VTAKLNVNKLQEGLHTERFGRNIIFLSEVGSTNDLAKKLAGYGAEEGTVVIAETQRVGHGRLGREWVSPAGGLWCSIILRAGLTAGEAVKLVFVAGLAVAETLYRLYGLESETKWPNDVLVKGRKICGILAEMKTKSEIVDFVVIGIGINADFDAKKALPEELWQRATSVKDELRKKVALEQLFCALLEKLEHLYDLFLKNGFAPILEKWKKHAVFLGHKVEIASQTDKLSGLAYDVDEDGALVLKLEDGTLKHILVGDVSLQTN